MIENIEQLKKNTNKLYLIAGHTISEICRIDASIEEFKTNVERIESQINAGDKIRKSGFLELLDFRNTNNPVKIINDIKMELLFLSSLSDGMSETLGEIIKSKKLQNTICLNNIYLSKIINKSINKLSKNL